MAPSLSSERAKLTFVMAVALGIGGLVCLGLGVTFSVVAVHEYMMNAGNDLSGLNLAQVAGVSDGTDVLDELESDAGTVMVDVSGAVNQPGVYALVSPARISDAIQSAGGIASTAALLAVAQQLNLAEKVTDGQKVFVPFATQAELTGSGDSATSLVKAGSKEQQDSSKISINHASQAELESLTGIGSKRATDIITGRPYQQIEDLVSNGILSTSVFETIKMELTL